MNKYQRGKIYTIRNYTDNTLIYVGSTIETLSKRMTKHRFDSKEDRCKNIILYQTVNGNWGDWYIELYEFYACNSKEELCKREGEIIRLIGTLNKNIAGRTDKEWYQDNKEIISEKAKEHYENNKEIILEKAKEYYEDNKEKKLEYQKEYTENNKENFLEKNKEYYEANRQKLLEKNKQIVICKYCDCEVTKNCLTRHYKSAKCQLIKQIKIL